MVQDQSDLGGRVLRATENPAAVKTLVAICLGVISILVAVRQGGPIFDDPYILFRYADNLGTGQGWTFNPEQTSENAVTSTLYVVLLAAMRICGLNVVTASAVIFCVTSFLAAAFTGLALERSGRRFGAVLAALLVVSSPVLSSFRGMESSLFLCLLAAALFVAVARATPTVLGLVLGLLVLSRPDGLIIAVVLAFVFFVLDRHRRMKWRGWLRLCGGATIPIVVGGLIVLVYSGSLFPSTLAAKTAQLDSGFWRPYLRGSWKAISALHDGGAGVVQFFLIVLVLAVCGGVVTTAVHKSAWQIVLTLLISTVGLVSFYFAVGIPAYAWYYALPTYSLLVFASVGFDSGIRLLTTQPMVRLASVATLAAILVIAGLQLSITSPTRDRIDFEEVGAWLRENTQPSSTIAAMEIGKIGWFSQRQMVDYLGLLDSGANGAVARGDFLWWPSHYQPDYWVTRGAFVDRPFFNSRCFGTSFTPVFRTNALTVYQRIQPIPDPAEC